MKGIESLAGQTVERVVEVPSQVDTQSGLTAQVVALVDQAGLSSTEWQTLPFVINLPSLNYSAATLLAELHGRMGYFPAMLRLRPVAGSVPPQFEVAEIVNLQGVRDEARGRR